MEMLIVLLIMGVVFAIAIPLYTESLRSSRLRACKANLVAIYQATEAYKVRNRTYTTNMADLRASLDDPLSCPVHSNGYALAAGSTGSIVTSVIVKCNRAGAHAGLTDPDFVGTLSSTQVIAHSNGTFSQVAP
jgi:Tfp pilus assembly protein PilE